MDPPVKDDRYSVDHIVKDDRYSVDHTVKDDRYSVDHPVKDDRYSVDHTVKDGRYCTYIVRIATFFKVDTHVVYNAPFKEDTQGCGGSLQTKTIDMLCGLLCEEFTDV